MSTCDTNISCHERLNCYSHVRLTNIYNERENFIRQRFQEWFRQSSLKEELMANVWHPKNFEKFKDLDPETFGEEF